MNIKRHTSLYLLALLVLLASSCSNTKHLPDGDSLFWGSKVHIKDNQANKQEKKVLAGDLAGVVRPKPNSKILGIPFKLSIYNAAGTPKKKKGGLKNFLRKVGEPPVLTSSVHLDANKALMTNLLQNRGFFYPTVTATLKTRKKKTTAVFDVTTGGQYLIDSVQLVMDSSQIMKDIASRFDESLLIKDAPYNLDLIKAERNRIDRNLKQIGYFYFKPDYLIVLVDSTIGKNKVNMYIRPKHTEVPEQAFNIYNIDSVYIFANYHLHANGTSGSDTEISRANNYKGYNIVDIKKTFKPQVFYDAMQFETGEEYNVDDQNVTLSRLVNMGTFKFVQNRFEPVGDTALNVYYYLTQYPRNSLSFQIAALTQNDNRAGSSASISLRRRNAFRGAEELLFRINGSFEAQYTGGESKQPNIYDLSAETDLSFPRFVVPFAHIYTSSRYLPRSIIKLRYSYESESDLLKINSYTASYGYDWKEGPHKEHQFYPINFTYVKTDTLGNAADLNLLYGNLIFNGIIFGPTYEYSYNSQGVNSTRNSFYFDGLADLSGNLVGLAQHADYETNRKTLFGSVYAQYIKLQPDFRYYLKLNNTSTFATRVLAGIGIPYGNSYSLPNIKEFWAGGNSDLRGFPSRLVGPGTFNAIAASDYLETLGDIKLELNAEIRQNIYKFLNAALFVDAGNIWLYRDNPEFPGGKFTSDFYKQLAVDAGLGLRLDFKILLLRLDLGIPIRKPWLIGNEWVLDQFNFGNSSWRKDNLVFNIAIGYPF